MKPVFQTRTGKGGNCFQACIASIFELELEQVPDFCNEDKENWLDHTKRWLQENYQFDFIVLDIERSDGTVEETAPKCLHIMTGIKKGSDILHSVVGFGGKIIHDPNPEQPGIESCKMIDVFVCTPTDTIKVYETAVRRRAEKLSQQKIEELIKKFEGICCCCRTAKLTPETTQLFMGGAALF